MFLPFVRTAETKVMAAYERRNVHAGLEFAANILQDTTWIEISRVRSSSCGARGVSVVRGKQPKRE
jgi:hypothetical protein